MADTQILANTAKSYAPFGRFTPVGTPAALRPEKKPDMSKGLSALGGMFDELNKPDMVDHHKKIEGLQRELVNIQSAYPSAGLWEKKALEDYAGKIKSELEEAKNPDNFKEGSSWLERKFSGDDSGNDSGGFFSNLFSSASLESSEDLDDGDVFGITKSKEEDFIDRTNRAGKWFSNYA